MKYVLSLLTKKQDSDDKYETLAEAANAGLTEVIGLITATGLENSKRYGDLYYEQLKGHIETIKKNVDNLRRVLCRFAFGTWGEPYSTAACINTAATFYGNMGIAPPAHYNEVFVAWGKAADAKGINDHGEYVEPDDSSEEQPDSSEEQTDSSEVVPETSSEETPDISSKPDGGNPSTGFNAAYTCGIAVTLAALAMIASKRKNK